jgi:hypothetical protein
LLPVHSAGCERAIVDVKYDVMFPHGDNLCRVTTRLIVDSVGGVLAADLKRLHLLLARTDRQWHRQAGCTFEEQRVKPFVRRNIGKRSEKVLAWW